MSTVDFVVAVIVVLSVVLSVLRGFTREVLTLVSLGGAVAAVYFGMPTIKVSFKHLFEDEGTATIAGSVIVFFVVLIVLSLLGHQIAKLVTKAGLGAVDRTMGPVFGLARALLLLCIMFVGMKWSLGADNLPDSVKHAKSTPIIAKTSARLVALLPANIQEEIQPDKDKKKDEKKEEDDDDTAPPEKTDSKTVKSVPPATPPAPPPEKPGEALGGNQEGYGNTERGAMDRLIGNEGKTK